ncbi:hypothetical protein Bca4012_018356 [Brassica carinata]
MYIQGADYVKTVLGIEGEYTAGEDHNRSKYVTMDYEHKVTVVKTLDNEEVTYKEETTNYLLRSLKRDNRCSLTLEYAQESHTIADKLYLISCSNTTTNYLVSVLSCI